MMLYWMSEVQGFVYAKCRFASIVGKEWHCSGHEYTFHQLFIKKFLQHFHFVSSSIVLRSSNSTVIEAAKQLLFVKFLALIQPSKQWMKSFHFYCVVLLSFDIGNCYCCSNNIPMEEFKCFDCYKKHLPSSGLSLSVPNPRAISHKFRIFCSPEIPIIF